MPFISGAGSGGGGGSVPVAQISATPPAGPTDGTLWILPADATNGVDWLFVYNSAETTYKWRFIGGPPLFLAAAPDLGTGLNGASMTQVGATGWYYYTTLGLFSTPRAGDYVCWGQASYKQLAGGSIGSQAGPGISNGTAIANESRTNVQFYAATSDEGSGTASDRITGVAASTSVGMVHSGSDLAHVGLRFLTMSLLPVRVI